MNKIQITRTHHLTGHKGPIYCLEKGYKPNTILSGGSDKLVAEWDLNQDDQSKLLAQSGSAIYTMKLIQEKKLLLIGQSAGGVHVVDLEKREEMRLLQYHEHPVFDIGYSSKHDLMFFLDGSGTFSVVDGNDLGLKQKFKISHAKIRNIAFNPGESEMALACGDNYIRIFSLPDLKPVYEFEAHRMSVNSVCYHPFKEHLLSGSKDAHLSVWDITNGFEQVHSVPAHLYAIYRIVFSPDNRLFASGSRDKTVKIWDAGSYELLKVIDHKKFKGHTRSVNDLLWNEEGLFSAGDDGVVMGWIVQQEQE